MTAQLTPTYERELRILSAAGRFVADHTSGAQRPQLLKLIDGVRTRIPRNTGWYTLDVVHLPLLVYAGCSGREEQRATPLAVAALLYGLGANILDDYLDGDAPRYGAASAAPAGVLHAATLLVGLAPLALCEVEGTDRLRAALHRELAQASVVIGGGQYSDGRLANSDAPDLAEVLACAENKTGRAMATFAAMGGRAALVSADRLGPLRAMGMALGTARQLAADLAELRKGPDCRDLKNGTRTLPIALHLSDLGEAERAAFLQLLADGREETACRTHGADCGGSGEVRELPLSPEERAAARAEAASVLLQRPEVSDSCHGMIIYYQEEARLALEHIPVADAQLKSFAHMVSQLTALYERT